MSSLLLDIICWFDSFKDVVINSTSPSPIMASDSYCEYCPYNTYGRIGGRGNVIGILELFVPIPGMSS
jgi:hypothetical protein